MYLFHEAHSQQSIVIKSATPPEAVHFTSLDHHQFERSHVGTSNFSHLNSLGSILCVASSQSITSSFR
jgi:hypothetical protein